MKLQKAYENLVVIQTTNHVAILVNLCCPKTHNKFFFIRYLPDNFAEQIPLEIGQVNPMFYRTLGFITVTYWPWTHTVSQKNLYSLILICYFPYPSHVLCKRKTDVFFQTPSFEKKAQNILSENTYGPTPI